MGRSRLGDLVALTRRGVVSDEDADELLSLLRGIMRASSVVIDQGFGATDFRRAIDPPREWLEYHTRNHEHDPTRSFLSRHPPGTWFLASQETRRRMGCEAFLTELRRCGQRDVAISKLYSPFRDDLFLIVYREKGRPSFSEEERARLTLLYPHLASAFASRRALAALRGESDDLRDRGCVEISFPSRRVAWTPRARSTLERALGPIGWRVHTRIDEAILRAADRFTSVNVGGRSQALMPGLRVELAAVPPERGETMRLVGVLLAESDDEPATDALPAEALLSPRQCEIARAAALGMSVADIAETLRLSVFTVRDHLKEIYRRLEVSNRAELTRLIGHRLG